MSSTTTDTAAATHSHTPGPWMWSDNRLGPVNPNLAASNVHSILDAEGGYGFLGSDVQKTIAELDADRVLIAAAPCMLAMLQELRECASYWSKYDVPVGIVERLDAVIAKATGQQGGAA